MTYTLLALFMLTGDAYVERQGLSLQGCAGHAAMARQEFLAVLPKLNKRVGEVRWQCVPERSLRRVERDERAIVRDN